MENRISNMWNEYTQKNELTKVASQVCFETNSDLYSFASYITNNRFNHPEVFTEPCKKCEGYGIVNETIVMDDNDQYLVGKICNRCNGFGRFNFIEVIKYSRKFKNDI